MTPTIFVLLLATASTASLDADVDHRWATTGMYPMWDTTGTVLEHRHAHVGTSAAIFGIGDVAEVGTTPTVLILRVPNLQAKVAVVSSGPLYVAVQLAAYLILPGANDSFASSRYTSRIYNPDQSLLATPLSVATTWRVTPWLSVHNTLTAVGVTAKAPIKSDLHVGDFVTVEMLAVAYHSLFLHVGEIGFWDHDQTVFGVSYRLSWDWLEARIGYFYRDTPDGMQSQPLASVAIQL